MQTNPCHDKLTKEVQELEQKVRLLNTYMQSHNLTIPPECIGFSWSGVPMIFFHTHMIHSEEDMAKYLSHIGHVCGRDGWVRIEDRYSDKFDWRKDVDGLQLHISGAEKRPIFEAPVPQNAFPLLLADGPVKLDKPDDISF